MILLLSSFLQRCRGIDMPNLFYHVIIIIGLRKCSCVSKDMSKDGGQLTAFLLPGKFVNFVNMQK